MDIRNELICRINFSIRKRSALQLHNNNKIFIKKKSKRKYDLDNNNFGLFIFHSREFLIQMRKKIVIFLPSNIELENNHERRRKKFRVCSQFSAHRVQIKRMSLSLNRSKFFFSSLFSHDNKKKMVVAVIAVDFAK